MLKSVAGLLVLAAAALARPQVDLAAFTPEQQLVIRQHEAIALANQPNPIADVSIMRNLNQETYNRRPAKSQAFCYAFIVC